MERCQVTSRQENYPLPRSPVIPIVPPKLTTSNNQLKGVGKNKDTFVMVVTLKKLLDVQQTFSTCETNTLCSQTSC